MMKYLFLNTPFQILSWYFFVLLGMVVGIGLAVIKRPEKDFPVTRGGIFACGLLMFCLAILGSKNLYILLYWDSFSVEEGLSWTRMFADAGYASLGAFSFYLLGIFMFTKFRVILKVADYAIPFTVLAQAFTKIGCFFAGCCYGKPTKLPWGVICPGETEVPVHPTQIYSSIYLLVVFFFMRSLYKKTPPPGITFFSGMLLYSVLRFLNESLRVDSVSLNDKITLSQGAIP